MISAGTVWAQRQPSATSQPECYTVNPAAISSANTNAAPPATAPTAAASSSAIGGPCGEFADFAPAFYHDKDLPELPVKTVRLIFHVMQKDDGTENWQSFAQDGGVDEAILRGLLNGLAAWPAGGRSIRGANNFYARLDARMTPSNAAVTPTPALAPYNDTRIRFHLDAVRYYRNTRYWNMSNGTASGCEAGLCLPELYRTFVVNTAANPGITGQPLNADEQANVIHVFFGESPGGPAGAALDRFGNPVSRYRIGGAANVPGNSVMMRGHYWALRNHPYWAPGQPNNPNNPQASFRYSAFVLAHELGHCLGLWHTFDKIGCSSLGVNDPPALTKGESNNLMDYPGFPGYSLSQCQIGTMHDALSSTFVGVTQAPEHWTRWMGTAQDNVITQSQTWSTTHNLRGDLYVNSGVTLTVRCRIGMQGPDAKIVVRRGGQLIFDGGGLGNYATSDVNEAPQNLLVRLGGNPADPNDADHSGLVEFRGAGCRLTSAKMQVELRAGATLHLAATARLDINKARLTTQAGSYFCVSNGARITRTGGGNFVTAPNTTLGIDLNLVGVNISPSPNCILTLCDLNAGLLSITGPVPAGTAFCQTGGPVALTVTGQPVPLPPGYLYEWFFNNASIGSGPSATVTHTPPNNTGAASVTHLYRCRVLPPGGCPVVVLDYLLTIAPVAGVTTVRNANPPAVCVPSPYGLYSLADLVSAVFGVPNPGQVKWGGPFVSYRGSYVFDVAAAVAAGITRQTITVTLVPAGANQCATPANITLRWLLGPALAVGASTTVACPPRGGRATQLTAKVPAGTAVTWLPGNNLTGTSVFVAPAVTTTYTATATNGLGCTSQRTVTVTVRPATCPVCEPDVVEMNPTQFGNQITAYDNGYLFESGKTYYFSTNTSFTSGQYVAEPGAILLFGPKVYLALGKEACLNLQGATLTATCDTQWGGIHVGYAASITARNTDKNERFYNEISHCQDGITYAEEGTVPSRWGCNTFDLDGVRFRHNLRSIQLFTEGASNPGQLNISNCSFEADPQQMLAPYAYESVGRQWCSYAHVSLGGTATNVTLENNTFRGALFGIWAPGVSNITASRNAFSDCYIAGAFNLSNESTGTWNRNVFNLADPYDDFTYQENDFVGAAYQNLAALGNVPGEISTPGTAVGLCASGEPLTVDGNQFLQTLDRGDYTGENHTPQTGLWAGPGTALLRRNVFQNLHLGAAAQAQQPAGGVADGNTFTNCRVGLTFINRDANTPPGDMKLTCNTFVRPNGKEGDSFAIYLGPGPYVPGQPGQQVNMAEELLPGNTRRTPILQTNRFDGVSPPYDPDNVQIYWHIYNDGGNVPFTYMRYNASANSQTPMVVPGDATVAGDDSGPTNAVVLDMDTRNQYQRGTNDCAAQGYPANVGLRPAHPNGGAVVTPYHLAQNAPNPCSGSTSVSYRLPAAETGELVVRDAFGGRVWLRQALGAGERTMELRLDKLPPGAYHYSLEVNGRPVAHHQLLVQ